MQIKNRQTFLLIVVASLLGLLILNSIVFDPLIESWKARSAKISKLTDDVNAAHQLIKYEPGIRRNWNGRKDNMLPTSNSQAEAMMMDAFDRWQRSSGITRSSYRTQWRQGNDDSYMTLECHADFSGNLRAITEFLYQLEKEQMAAQLESMQLTARDNNGREMTLTLQVSSVQLAPSTNSVTQ